MQKSAKNNLIIWLVMLVIVPLIAGFYGALHDQVTYSLSPEYFTNFKFIQFGISEHLRDSERVAAGFVGFLATWWVGIPIAILIGGIGFKSLTTSQFIRLKLKGVLVVFIVAIVTGFIGFLFGWYKYSQMSDWPMNFGFRAGSREMMLAMSQIKDWISFYIVGTIHGFSYLGGLIGVVVSVFYQVRNKRTIV